MRHPGDPRCLLEMCLLYLPSGCVQDVCGVTMNVTVTYGTWGYKTDKIPGIENVDPSLLSGALRCT